MRIQRVYLDHFSMTIGLNHSDRSFQSSVLLIGIFKSRQRFLGEVTRCTDVVRLQTVEHVRPRKVEVKNQNRIVVTFELIGPERLKLLEISWQGTDRAIRC